MAPVLVSRLRRSATADLSFVHRCRWSEDVTKAAPNAVTDMPKSKRKRKKRASARHIKEVAGLIAIQQRRAARPAIAVNTQARVSESLVERRRKLDTKRRQRRDWDDL